MMPDAEQLEVLKKNIGSNNILSKESNYSKESIRTISEAMRTHQFPEQSELDFFSTENTLKEIEAEVIAFPSSISDLDNKYQEEMQETREKFDKQRRLLREAPRQISPNSPL